MKNVIIGILAAALVGGGVAMYFLLVAPAKTTAAAEAAKPTPTPTLYAYEPGDYFLTNVKGSKRLLKTTIVLMLDSEKISTTLDEKQPIIRDTIIFTLRSLTEQDILSEDIGEKLRTELTDKLNQTLGITNIVTINFSEFVMQ